MVAPLLIVSSSGWACTKRSRWDEVTRPSSGCAIDHRRVAARHAVGSSHLPMINSQDLGDLGVVAGVRMPRAAVLQLRLDVDAQPPLGVGELARELLAAGAEPAARRRIGRARDVAG